MEEDTNTNLNINDLLYLFQQKVLDETLTTVKEFLLNNSFEDLEESLQNSVTVETPNVFDCLEILRQGNYERDELLRESHIIGQQYEFLKKELEYYRGLLNKP